MRGGEWVLGARGGDTVHPALSRECRLLLRVKALGWALEEVIGELIKGFRVELDTEKLTHVQTASVDGPPEDSGYGKKRTEARERENIGCLVCFAFGGHGLFRDEAHRLWGL